MVHDGFVGIQYCVLSVPAAVTALELSAALHDEQGGTTNLGFEGCGPCFDDVSLGLPNQLDVLHSVAAVGALAVVTEHSCGPATA